MSAPVYTGPLTADARAEVHRESSAAQWRPQP